MGLETHEIGRLRRESSNILEYKQVDDLNLPSSVQNEYFRQISCFSEEHFITRKPESTSVSA